MSVDCIGMAVMMMLLMTMTSGHIFTPIYLLIFRE